MKNIILAIVLSLIGLPSFAQLRVMMSGGFSNPYKKLAPEFEHTSGITLKTLSGASQGSGTHTIKYQLEHGENADVVILSREGLSELMASGLIAANTDKDLGIAPLAAAVKHGEPKPDISTKAKFKEALLSARRIVIPASTSGIFLVNTVFPSLDLPRSLNITKTERGRQAVEYLSSGRADFAILPTSELMFAPGLEVIGRLPRELQLLQIFAIAVVKDSAQFENAQKLITFLTSPNAYPDIQNGGMDLITQ